MSLCYDVSGMIVSIAFPITLASIVRRCIIASAYAEIGLQVEESCSVCESTCWAQSHLQALADPEGHPGGLAPVLMLPPGRLCASAVAAALRCYHVAVWTGAGLHLTMLCHMYLDLHAYTSTQQHRRQMGVWHICPLCCEASGP